MASYQDKEYYNRQFNTSKKYNLPYKQARTYILFQKVINQLNILMKELGKSKAELQILELGCGTGQLAAYLEDEGFTNYVGVDFSDSGIRIARDMSKQKFECDDCTAADFFKKHKSDVIISTEVFEHLKDDLSVIDRIPINLPVIFSVPSFDCPSHVRWFVSQIEVENHYGKLLKNISIEKIVKQKNDIWYVVTAIRKK